MNKSAITAAFLSACVPGAGQLYNGDRQKGIAMICLALGVWIGVLLSHSFFSLILLAVIYLAVLIPAVRDAYLIAQGNPSPFTGERIWYVVWMLLCVGPLALPLLWKSNRFSKRAKIIWTILVILIGIIGIWLAVVIGPIIDQLMESYGIAS